MLSNLEKYRIILGSASPRRQELLRGLDISFEVMTKDLDETWPEGMYGVDIPMFLAELKANAFKKTMEDNTLLITADTIVWHEGIVFGKPTDRDNAIEMLLSLSGKTHQVITGVCISTKKKKKIFSVITNVRFSRILQTEAAYYVDKYHPFDKAGSYGVQEWIGFIGVEYIEGSFYNVMGLPVQRLYNELKHWND